MGQGPVCFSAAAFAQEQAIGPWPSRCCTVRGALPLARRHPLTGSARPPGRRCRATSRATAGSPAAAPSWCPAPDGTSTPCAAPPLTRSRPAPRTAAPRLLGHTKPGARPAVVGRGQLSNSSLPRSRPAARILTAPPGASVSRSHGPQSIRHWCTTEPVPFIARILRGTAVQHGGHRS